MVILRNDIDVLTHVVKVFGLFCSESLVEVLQEVLEQLTWQRIFHTCYMSGQTHEHQVGYGLLSFA